MYELAAVSSDHEGASVVHAASGELELTARYTHTGALRLATVPASPFASTSCSAVCLAQAHNLSTRRLDTLLLSLWCLDAGAPSCTLLVSRLDAHGCHDVTSVTLPRLPAPPLVHVIPGPTLVIFLPDALLIAACQAAGVAVLRVVAASPRLVDLGTRAPSEVSISALAAPLVPASSTLHALRAERVKSPYALLGALLTDFALPEPPPPPPARLGEDVVHRTLRIDTSTSTVHSLPMAYQAATLLLAPACRVVFVRACGARTVSAICGADGGVTLHVHERGRVVARRVLTAAPTQVALVHGPSLRAVLLVLDDDAQLSVVDACSLAQLSSFSGVRALSVRHPGTVHFALGVAFASSSALSPPSLAPPQVFYYSHSPPRLVSSHAGFSAFFLSSVLLRDNQVAVSVARSLNATSIAAAKAFLARRSAVYRKFGVLEQSLACLHEATPATSSSPSPAASRVVLLVSCHALTEVNLSSLVDAVFEQNLYRDKVRVRWLSPSNLALNFPDSDKPILASLLNAFSSEKVHLQLIDENCFGQFNLSHE